MSTLNDIEALAQKLAQESIKEGTTLQSQIDAIKVLAPFFVILSKSQSKNDGDENEPSIGDIQNRLRLVEEQ